MASVPGPVATDHRCPRPDRVALFIVPAARTQDLRKLLPGAKPLRDLLLETLVKLGYRRTELASQPGEFSGFLGKGLPGKVAWKHHGPKRCGRSILLPMEAPLAGVRYSEALNPWPLRQAHPEPQAIGPGQMAARPASQPEVAR